MTNTARLGLRRIAGADPTLIVTDWDHDVDILDNAAIFMRGTIASIPAPGIVPEGTLYFATDQEILYVQIGGDWTVSKIYADILDAAVARRVGMSQTGAVRSEIFKDATERKLVSQTYALMPTASDIITGISVPADAVVRLRYWARWRVAVAGAAFAAIFIRDATSNITTQLKLATQDNPNPVVQEVSLGGSVNNRLTTCQYGLASGAGGTNGQDLEVTTGQAWAIGPSGLGGPCEIHGLPAGTYDFMVAFKNTALNGEVYRAQAKMFVEVQSYDS